MPSPGFYNGFWILLVNQLVRVGFSRELGYLFLVLLMLMWGMILNIGVVERARKIGFDSHNIL